VSITIDYLIEKEIAFMGANWQPDSSIKEGLFPGHKYVGEIPCIFCNDLFWWACSDAENITVETLPLLEKAINDCKGNEQIGALLFCARQRKMRPQGACYSWFSKELWPLLDECGSEREIDFGNPFKPGEYK
jgi:hypothetical protein